ncbi:MAG TPA: aminoacyl-tRNA hydrolase [Clostridia bacterium]|nr:aminoacyl-tRNA hydrolase [Clostridia bacterium]
MKLVVGLGNPGMKYMDNRHNVGFMVVDRIAASIGVKVNNFMCKSLVGKGRVGGRQLILAKPVTFMNLCGDAVGLLLERFGLDPGEMIVIYDDMDLDFGSIRIRPKGGDGGHRGLGSIIARTGTSEFPRLRVGIGRPEDDIVDYVLGDFSKDELVTIKQSIERASDAVLYAAGMGLTAAMNQYNG